MMDVLAHALRRSSVANLLLSLGLAASLGSPLVSPAAPAQAAAHLDITLSPCTETAYTTALNSIQSVGGGTLNLSCSGIFSPLNITKQSRVTTPITITGGVLSIASVLTRHFSVANTGRLTLNGTLLDGGEVRFGGPCDTYCNGGAIILDPNAVLTATDAIFSNNYADGAGGAIGPAAVSSTANIKLIRSTFLGNRTQYAGGAIYMAGTGTIQVDQSSFDDNRATLPIGFGKSVGGAIQVDGPVLSLVDSTLNNNQADFGGALAVANTAAHISGGDIYSNTARDEGGGIYVSPGSLSITGTTIASNTAILHGGGIRLVQPAGPRGMLSVSAAKLHGNYGYAKGGAISLENGMASISTSVFTANQSAALGAGVYAVTSDVWLTDTHLVAGQNNAGTISHLYGSAGLYLENAKLSMTGGSIKDGIGYAGAAIHSRFSQSQLEDVQITGNRGSSGAGLFALNSTVVATRTTFSGNVGASGFADNGGGIYGLGAHVTLIDSTVTQNSARDSGGGLYMETGNLTLRNTRVSTNTSHEGAGGGIYAKDVTLDVNGGAMIGNRAVFSSSVPSSGWGGALRITGTAPANIAGTQFADNVGSAIGGAIHSAVPLTIAGAQFHRNQSDVLGGAIYQTGSDVAIANTAFIGNQSGSGGAVYVRGRHMSTTGGSFDGNIASVDGGAIAGRDATLWLTDTTMTGNQAASYGGGIMADTTGPSFDVRLTRVQLRNSTAGRGGGLAVVGFSVSPADIVITDSEFSNNHATAAGAQGGAILVSSGRTVLRGTRVLTNSGTVGGGGFFSFGGALTVENSVFMSNTARTALGIGGGLYSGNPFTVSNVIFERNTTGGVGGAIHTYAPSKLDLVSFIDNRAEGNGGALWLGQGGSSARIENATFVSNTSNANGGGLYADGTSASTLKHVTFSANGAALGAAVFLSTTAPARLQNVALARGVFGANCAAAGLNAVSDGNNLADDGSCSSVLNQPTDLNNTPAGLGPLAANSGTVLPGVPMRTLLPLPGSRLIDGGECLPTITLDQRGVARPIDGNGDGLVRCDIGAVEFSAPPLKTVFLPALRR